MMIQNNHIQPAFHAVFQHIKSRCAAVDRNQQIGTVLHKLVHSLTAWAITFISFGNMNHRFNADAFQKQTQNRSRSRPVNVIIADNGDFLMFGYCSGNPLGRLFHIFQHKRIRHQILQLGIQKVINLIFIDFTRSQYSCHQRRQTEFLRNQLCLPVISRR